MNGTTTALVLGIAVSATLGIWGHYKGDGRSPLIYIFRPLAGVLILALALTGDRAADPRYYWAIAAGLVFALIGDVLLMVPKDLFVFGLLGFAGTHICFLVAFTSGAPFAGSLLPFAIFALVGVSVVAYIWGGVGKALKGPVIFYVALLVAMASQSWSRHLDLGGHLTLLAAIGGTLFLSSDAILSVDTFKKPFRSARFWILSTFYVADALIALSVAR